jgi:hypothetical protein
MIVCENLLIISDRAWALAILILHQFILTFRIELIYSFVESVVILAASIFPLLFFVY